METGDCKILNFASVSGTNIGDCLIAEMIPYLSKRSIALCDTRGKLIDRNVGRDFSINSVEVSVNIARYVPRAIKRQAINFLVKKRHTSLSKSYDEVWIGGGNLLFDRGCDNLEMTLSIARSFNKAGKAVKLISVGVGPFVSDPTKALREIAEFADTISVRDERSQEALDSFGISSTILIDPVWYLGDSFISRGNIFNDKKKAATHFGVNVMHPKVLGVSVQYEKWVEETAKNVIAIAKATGLLPILIISSYDNSDPEVAFDLRRKICQLEQEKIEVMLLPAHTSTKTEVEIFIHLAFVLTHRMHVAISALALNIPTLVFPWQKKVEGVLSSVYAELTSFMILQESSYLVEDVLSKLDDLKRLKSGLEKNLKMTKKKYRLVYENI